jgi:uncharacterized protein YcbK (DUF882 family)
LIGDYIMTLKIIGRICGAPIASIAACLVGIAAFAPTSAHAQDSWANAIIKEMKAAEKQVATGNVRVAALGATTIPTSTSTPAAPKRSAASSSDDRPRSAPVKKEASAPVKNVKVAAVSNRSSDADRPRRSLSGGSVNWLRSASCLDSDLRGVIYAVAAKFGPVTVNSTCRDKAHNRRVGGASKSYHLTGDAADFRVSANSGSIMAYLRGNGDVGGLKHYGGGLFHIDNGPRRSW